MNGKLKNIHVIDEKNNNQNNQINNNKDKDINKNINKDEIINKKSLNITSDKQ